MSETGRGAGNLVNGWTSISRNCKLMFLGSSLNGVAQGIFLVVFNLYILSLGISPDVLGGILSAGPFAQALGSIPMGFLMEKIGFKKVFIMIYGFAGLTRIAQVATGSVPLIAISAFICGLALAGDFVVRLPFIAANSEPERRPQMYSLSSIFYSVSTALGSLFAGFAPNLVHALLKTDLAITYRYTLYFGGLLTLLAVVPFLLLADQPPLHTRKISLAPYLWGIDRFTTQQAIVSLFVGVSLGLTMPFMNIYFVYHLGASREFFGTMSALVIIPSLIATAAGPLLAVSVGAVRLVTYLRGIIPLFLANLAITTNPWLGTIAYWGQSALSNTAQPLSFAFAMNAATPRAKSAASAWLNVTFWLGNAMAAPIAGAFIAKSQYRLPLFISAAAILLAAISNEVFFNRIEISLKRQEKHTRASEVETS